MYCRACSHGSVHISIPLSPCSFSWNRCVKQCWRGEQRVCWSSWLLFFCFLSTSGYSLSPLSDFLFPSVLSLMCVSELWICVCKGIDSNSMAVWIFKVQTKLDESKIDHNCQTTGSNNRANNSQRIEKKTGKLLREKSNLKGEFLYSTPAAHRFSRTISQRSM